MTIDIKQRDVKKKKQRMTTVTVQNV